MSKTNDGNYLAVLLEEIRDQNKPLLEGQAALIGLPTKVNEVQTEVTELAQDTKIIKAAVTDTTHQVNDHEHRIMRLEAAS